MPALGRALLWLPVVVAPLLAGTAERPYTLWVAALGALVGLAAAVRVGRRSEELHVSLFAVALFLALVATLLQCVPLPPGLRAALAPGSDATLRQLLAGLGDPAVALPLSVDPAATANEAVRLAGYLSLLVALGTLRQRRGHSVRLGRVLCGTSSVVAALGALAALGVPLPALWAVPADGATRALLPAVFYNSNHMAALLAVGGTVTVGAALQAAGRGERVLYGLYGVLLGLQDLALLGTLSRAGILVGLGGQLIVLLSCRGSSLRALARLSLPALAVPLLAAGLLVVGSPGWRGGLRLRFAALSPAELLAAGSKVRAWLDALPLLRGHWAFGVGRGAFEDAFAGAHRLAGATRFVYLENQWLQAVVDWGVPVGLGLGALVGLGLRDGWRGLGRRAPADAAGSMDLVDPHAPGRRAAFVALLGLLLHNLVDFNLEVGGVAVAAIALVAVVERPRLRVRPRWAVLLAAAALLGSAAVLRLCPLHEEDGARLRTLAESTAGSAEVVSQGTRAARRHPLDSYLYATVATRLWHDREPAAVRWVNLALNANPRDLLARRTSALLLAETGHRGQALRTLALAVGDGNRVQRRWLFQAALTMAPTPTELLTALPEAPDELPVGASAGLLADELLELLSESGAAGPPWPLLRAVAQWGRERGAATALVWLGRAALAQRDTAAARDLLDELARTGAPPLLLADLLNLLIDAGSLDEAARLVRPLMTGSPPPEVLLTAARLSERRGELTTARALLDTAQATASPALRARVHEVRAELEERAGNLHRAQIERAAAAPPHP